MVNVCNDIANGLFWRGALELRRHLRLACASPSRVAALWQMKNELPLG